MFSHSKWAEFPPGYGCQVMLRPRMRAVTEEKTKWIEFSGLFSARSGQT
jgi:hypothetical protein